MAQLASRAARNHVLKDLHSKDLLLTLLAQR
jgi:hypothetical protein